jgi:CheY-like chemotaxis protein
MNSIVPKSIFLADDDLDDRILFQEALKEVCQKTKLTTANDGQHLMEILYETVPPPPDVIFLDLNMPRKDGFECLDEIKHTEKLKDIPIVVFSTSSEEKTIERVYARGAHYYIRKPGTFVNLKKTIEKVLTINWTENFNQPDKGKFILQL